ncbi:nicotinamidase-like [Clytia hemisphaerica]|uniref:nicotinamidase n=1 Tax=Clytia hemisphaerica TaxID=252671 RepID=A0A7M5V061_9CNID
MKLLKISGYFDYLREGEEESGEEERDFSEQKCLEVLQNLQMEQYEEIADIPMSALDDLFLEVIGGDKYIKMDPNQEQDVLDLFEECTVDKKVDLEMMAKVLGYLLRRDCSKKTALLVVDVQNDFISGSLALKNSPANQDGEEIVEVVNNILEEHPFDAVVYTTDWHPEDHCSFYTNVSKYPLHESSTVSAEEAKVLDKVVYDGDKPIEQVLWPPHCIQESEGAELHSELNVKEDSIRILKGTHPQIDSYSAFWDNGRSTQTILFQEFIDRKITHVFVCGLATDFCVAYTAFDSNTHGFQTFVIEDACRGVCDESIEGMKTKEKRNGIKIIESSDIKDIIEI